MWPNYYDQMKKGPFGELPGYEYDPGTGGYKAKPKVVAATGVSQDVGLARDPLGKVIGILPNVIPNANPNQVVKLPNAPTNIIAQPPATTAPPPATGLPAAPTPPTAPTAPATTGTPKKYSPEYYEKIRTGILGQLQSPAEKEAARLRRSQLAGSGILSGSAYDTLQTQRVGEVETEADQAVNQAMIEGAEYEAGSNERKLATLKDQIDILAPLANAAGASAEIKKQYNKLVAEYLEISGEVGGLPAPVDPGTGTQTGTGPNYPYDAIKNPTGYKAPGQEPIDYTMPKAPGEANKTRRETAAPQLSRASTLIESNLPIITKLYDAMKSGGNPEGINKEKFMADWDRLMYLDDLADNPNAEITDAEISEYIALSDKFIELGAAGDSGRHAIGKKHWPVTASPTSEFAMPGTIRKNPTSGIMEKYMPDPITGGFRWIPV